MSICRSVCAAGMTGLIVGSGWFSSCSKCRIDRVQVFINKCLRRILNIHWPDRITNKELWKKTNDEPVLDQLRRRKWNWKVDGNGWDGLQSVPGWVGMDVKDAGTVGDGMKSHPHPDL